MEYKYKSYFLNEKNIIRFLENKVLKPETKPLPPPPPVADNSDKLFWLFFIVWKGEVEYEHLKLMKKIEYSEKLLKIEFLEKINASRKNFKKSNIATAEANLMEKNITVNTLFVLAAIEKVNILFSFKKSFYLSINDSSKPCYHINKAVEEISEEKINEIKETMIQRCDVDKILYNISNYKLAELKELYKKISNSSEKMTKQKLYDEIIKQC
jgi:hypothetical protein